MGDRNGLPKLDRTNGYEDGRNYMNVKKTKLADQNDQIRDALRRRNQTLRTDIFKGVSIHVNGRTKPTADELKRLILLNGGEYHPYYRYKTTKFMIATNLSIARTKHLRPDDRIVRPEWITESIEAKCLLPYQDYQLFVESPRGKTSSVLPITIDETSNSSHVKNSSNLDVSDVDAIIPIAQSYNQSYRSSSSKQIKDRKGEKKESNSRDIREMFSKISRDLDNKKQQKHDSLFSFGPI